MRIVREGREEVSRAGGKIVDTKVPRSCNMDGVYDPNEQIWHLGDLRMAFRGR